MKIDRRKYLAGIATTGLGLTAGCTGGDGEDTPQDTPTEPDQTPMDETDTPGQTPPHETATPEAGMPDPLRIGFPSTSLSVWGTALIAGVYPEAKAQGIQVNEITHSGHIPMVASFVRDDIDAGFISINNLVSARLQGFPIKAFCGLQQELTYPFAVRADLDGWEDVRGSTVAFHAPGSLTGITAQVMIEEELGSLDEVGEVIYMSGTSNRLAAMERGEVDASAVVLSLALQAQKDGYIKILAMPWDYDVLSGLPQNVWVTTEDALDEREGEYQAFTDQMLEAYDSMYTDDVDSILDLSFEHGDQWFGGQDREIIRESFSLMRENELWPRDGGLDAESVQASQQFYFDNGFIDDTVPVDEIVDRRFLD